MSHSTRDNRERDHAEAGARHDILVRQREHAADFTAFATDLTKANALVLSKPVQLFGVPALPDPNLAASIAEEFFTEGRQHRPAPAGVNYEDES